MRPTPEDMEILGGPAQSISLLGTSRSGRIVSRILEG